jgi:hypothetical protein
MIMLVYVIYVALIAFCVWVLNSPIPLLLLLFFDPKISPPSGCGAGGSENDDAFDASSRLRLHWNGEGLFSEETEDGWQLVVLWKPQNVANGQLLYEFSQRSFETEDELWSVFNKWHWEKIGQHQIPASD